MALDLNGKWCNGVALCPLTAQAILCFSSCNDTWLSQAGMAFTSMTHAASSAARNSPCQEELFSLYSCSHWNTSVSARMSAAKGAGHISSLETHLSNDL